MRGKTNALHELRDISSIDLLADSPGTVYDPADYGVAFFGKVTTVRDNALLKAYCEDRTHDITAIDTAGITLIRSNAFREDFSLRYVTLADSVVTLNNYAFYNSRIQSFDSGAGLVDLGERSFDSCAYLESANIHGNQTVIKLYSFASCKKLTDLTLGEGVLHIKQYAFYNCYKLNPVILPTTLTNIDDNGFFINTDNVSQAQSNKQFYLLFKRRPVLQSGSLDNLEVAPTKLGLTICKNRATQNKYAFVPWDCYLIYKNYSSNANAGIWTNAGVWIEAQAGDTLPATSRQLYSSYDVTYNITWYAEPTCQTAVTVAPSAGIYYGAITEVE